MNRRQSFAWGLLGVLALVLAHWAGAQADEPVHEFSGWPSGWAKGYQRFETYIAARHANSPWSDLHILPGGEMIHIAGIASSSTEHLGLQVFRRGCAILHLMTPDNLLHHEKAHVLTPGAYSACLYASSAMGYQHIYPLIHFEVNTSGLSADARTAKVKMLDHRQSDAFWPNERLLLFLDFHVFGRGHPWDIQKANRKIAPAVLLQVNAAGAIVREKLKDEAAEKLLRWRIYCDGELIESGPAAGVLRMENQFGPGSYHVWVGVEGPQGFMPVSNLLEFPLFPQPGGTVAVIPADTDADGIPDFLKPWVEEDDQWHLESFDIDWDRDGGRSEGQIEERPLGIRSKVDVREAERRLVELWQAWYMDLKYQPAMDHLRPLSRRIAPPAE